MKRRTFVGGAVVAVASAGGGFWWWLRRSVGIEAPDGAEAAVPSGPVLAPDGRPVFGLRHRATLMAFVARLVPDDDQGAGAATIGAFGYIERALAARPMQGTRQVLMRGAAVLDKMAQARGGTLFDRLGADEQDEVVAAMVAGEGATPKFDPKRFVQLSLALTLEGMFSDPIKGGNVDGLGWGTIGYAMHPPRPGQCHPAAAGAHGCE